MLKYQLLLGLFVLCAHLLSAQNVIQGTILSEDDNGPLVGANILIDGTTEGTTTNFDGSFLFTTERSFPLQLIISYIGHESQTLMITDGTPINLRLKSASLITDEVIISASRRAEKLQEAPAAVSVIGTKEIANSGGAITPIRSLINQPGVELQQQTGQRINLALRGSSSVFATSVFPMLDYRSLISPGVEFFDSQNSPINNIDLERIEVVLGPGSALYGPDVTSGVVHFISKDPFTHPGTTVELIFGEMNTFKSAIRHAGHSKNGKFGYKVNARYGSGTDFALDPNDPIDRAFLGTFQSTIRRGFVTDDGFIDPQVEGPVLLEQGQLQNPEYVAAAVNGQLHFKPGDQTRVVASGGWNTGEAIFYNELGEGYNQSNEYWGQLRLNHEGLFVQTYFIHNDGGSDDRPSYLHRSGLIAPLERTHFEAQVQYNFDTPAFLNAEWTTGFDFRTAATDSENHVFGRNEEDDDYRIFGGYLQGKLKLHEKLDLFLAGRVDGYNFTDQSTFSPRAALVYKPNQFHSLRVSYNQAANPIPASDIYFDLPIQTTPLFNIWNIGAGIDQTFTDPTITWVIPGVPETAAEDGFPLSAIYQAVTPDVIAGLEAAAAADPALAPILPIILGALQSQQPEGFSSLFDQTDLAGEPLSFETNPAELIGQLTAIEFGYKGLFFEKLAAGFDVYYYRNANIAGFSQVSPVVTLTNLPDDLANGVQSLFQPQIEQALLQNGFDPTTAASIAGQVGGILNGAYNNAGQGFINTLGAAGLPFHGIIQPDQAPDTGLPNLTFGYPTRNPGQVSDDWGFEFHTKYYFSEILTAFANYTWFNRPTGNPGDLNFPQNKIRTGVNYGDDLGFKGSLVYQWDQAYTSNVATFPGAIDARSLFDLTVGYGLSNGLVVEASATNLFDNEFRSLPGFPRIGRRASARLLYDF